MPAMNINKPFSNPWQLYTTIPGWENCAHRLDQAVASELAGLDRMVESGTPVSLAAHATFTKLATFMSRPNLIKYGASDSEPRSHLASLIQKHIREVHHSKLYVDRFGDVSEF